MTTIINISGEIGWDVEVADIEVQLQEAKGGDIDVYLDTLGGYVFDGIRINNLISDYKKDNPDAQIMITVKSVAASMGSYIMSNNNADLTAVMDNATAFFHHPLCITRGNYLDHDKTSGMLKGLSKIMANQYSAKSGKSFVEAMEIMAEDTWLFGQEIVDAGFADVVITTDNQKDKSEAIALGKIAFQKVLAKMKTDESYGENFMQAAAFIGDFKEPKSPFANEHAARLLDPKIKHERVRRTNGSGNGTVQGVKIPETISIIWYIVKSDGKEVPRAQSLRFPTKNWTEEKAKKYLSDNKIKFILFEAASGSQGSMEKEMKSDFSDDNIPADSGIKKEVYMTLEELKAKNPELYNQVYNIGVEAGKVKIQEGIKNLLELKEKAEWKGITPIQERIDAGIKNNEPREEVVAGILTILSNGNIQAAIESTGDIDTGIQNTQVSGGPKAPASNMPASVEV